MKELKNSLNLVKFGLRLIEKFVVSFHAAKVRYEIKSTYVMSKIQKQNLTCGTEAKMYISKLINLNTNTNIKKMIRTKLIDGCRSDSCLLINYVFILFYFNYLLINNLYSFIPKELFFNYSAFTFFLSFLSLLIGRTFS